MGLADLVSDFFATVDFLPTAYAEAPKEDKPEDDEDDKQDGGDDKEEGGDDEGKDEDKEDDGEDGGDDEEKDEPEEEEEEEDEPEDLKPKLEEECARSRQCAPLKHHYDECAERVTKQHEDPNHKGPKEDCVEEFFHLTHCATQCAAPKLFAQLR